MNKRRTTGLLAALIAAALLLAFVIGVFGVPASALLYGDILLGRSDYSGAEAMYLRAEELASARPLCAFLTAKAEKNILHARELLFLSQNGDVQALCDEGRFDEAEAYLDAANITGENRLVLLDIVILARAKAAEAAGDSRAALAYYMQLDSETALLGAARCEKRVTILDAQIKFDEGACREAMDMLAACGDFEDAPALLESLTARYTEILGELAQKYRNAIAAGAWYTAVGMDAPCFVGDGAYAAAAVGAGTLYGGVVSVLSVADGRVGCFGSALGAREELAEMTDVVSAAAGINHMLILRADGTVVSLGSLSENRTDAADWSGIAAVAAGAHHSIGLRQDGTVLAAGSNQRGQCDVSDWTNVTMITAGLYHTVGLREDGTVVACGDNAMGQCDVSGWTNILSVSCGAEFTVGLRDDFTLVAAGSNASGQCEVSAWHDIIAVAAGVWHTAALRADGKVLFAGADTNGQCTPDTLFVNTGVTGTDEVVHHLKADAAAPSLIYNAGESVSPWLYLSPDGLVSISYDFSHDYTPIRADLFATAGCIPSGYIASQDFTLHTRALPAQIARENRVVFAQTGDYMGHLGNIRGVLIRQGQFIREAGINTSCAFMPDGTLAVYPVRSITAAELMAVGVQDCYSFGPILVSDGKVVNNAEHPLAHSTAPRSAIGYIEPYHYVSIVSSLGNMLMLDTLASIFVDYGAVAAYNMDGGNSTCMVFMGEPISLIKYNYHSNVGIRALTDVLGFLTDESVPTLDDTYLRSGTVGAPE